MQNLPYADAKTSANILLMHIRMCHKRSSLSHATSHKVAVCDTHYERREEVPIPKAIAPNKLMQVGGKQCGSSL